MKSLEASTQNSTQVIETIVLPENVKAELKEIIINLKIILEDNPRFFSELVQKCMLVGKNPWGENAVYFNDIEEMIKSEYPDYLKYEEGHKLLKTSRQLAGEICLESKLIQSITYNQSLEVNLNFRIMLEKEISFFIEKDFNINLVGDYINE